jgi:hypothetical protein
MRFILDTGYAIEIPVKHIYFLEAGDDDTTEIHLTSGQVRMARGNLNDITERVWPSCDIEGEYLSINDHGVRIVDTRTGFSKEIT